MLVCSSGTLLTTSGSRLAFGAFIADPRIPAGPGVRLCVGWHTLPNCFPGVLASKGSLGRVFSAPNSRKC